MMNLLVGTYTETLPHVKGKAPGILSLELVDGLPKDSTAVLASLRNPSWIALSGDGTALYAVVETVDFQRQPGGGVAAYRRSVTSGELTLINTASSAGLAPAHLAMDPSGKYLLVANYRSGSVAVFRLAEDGGLGEMVDLVQHSGSSVHPIRQTGPHAHQIVFDPVTGRLLVPDLGKDAVLNYTFEDGRLTEVPEAVITTQPGAGPRHLAFHPDGRHLLLLNELDNTLEVHRRNGSGFERVHRVSTLPPDFTGHSQASAVRVTASGSFVLTSNRGLDTIAMFSFEAATGAVTLVHLAPSGGKEPRDMVVSPDGAHLFVANQDSDNVRTFSIDESAGLLRHLSTVAVPTPVCLVPAG